jgi:hypothetical protein
MDMQEIAPKKRLSFRLEVDRDIQLKQAMDSLESENSGLRSLVVQLSATIMRNVVAKR